MGGAASRANLYAAIEAGNAELVERIIAKNRPLLNDPITSDRRSNSICRAAFLGKTSVVSALIQLGADVDATGES